MTWPLLLQAFATFAMTGLIWFVQVVHYPLFRAVGVPRHEALRHGFDAPVHAALVATNWVRTAAWTARSGPLLLALRAALR
jgi:hypothetical protein